MNAILSDKSSTSFR